MHALRAHTQMHPYTMPAMTTMDTTTFIVSGQIGAAPLDRGR